MAYMKAEYEALTDELMTTLDTLIHWLSGIREDVMKGDYSPEDAKRDAEAMTHHESMDVLSVLTDLADLGEGMKA
jgi:hypothetical protein